MSDAGRKWWLRTVAAVIGGGGTLTGAWVGFSRSAVADQNPPLTQVSEQLTNATQIPPPEPFERPRAIEVVPISATAPPAPGALPPAVEPVVPLIPSAGPEMGLQPPASLPLPPAPSALPAPSAIPEAKPIVPVAAPFPPSDVPPLPTPSVPAIPAPSETPKPSAIPPLPAIETPKLPAVPAAEKPKVPAVPVTPPDLGVPSVAVPVPVLPVESAKPTLPPVPDLGTPIPTPTGVTPPPLPAKVTEPVVPSGPAKPDSGLPTGNGGINVKPDKVGGTSSPVVPVVPKVTVPDPVKVPDPSDGGFKIPATPVKTPVVPAEPTLIEPKLPYTIPGPVEDRTKPVETPRRDPEKNFSPIPSTTHVPTPGDNTMIPVSRAAAVAVLGGMLLAPTTPAQAVTPSVPFPTTAIKPVVPIQADDKSEVTELKKQLEESNRKLAMIQEQLKGITEALSGKKDDKGFTLESDRGIVAELKEFKNRLAQIEKDLANYKTQTSLRPANPVTPVNPIVDPKAGKGTIRVVNEYPVQISIVVNGMSYRIAPSKTLDVDVSAGEFSYQLLESGAALTKSVIKEKETVTLRIK
ncbi:MAG: hypothetical protein K8U57_18185 [Planctomycetes bacterium]|nr:hypothetical protein [Planctomycetota bacterium]